MEAFEDRWFQGQNHSCACPGQRNSTSSKTSWRIFSGNSIGHFREHRPARSRFAVLLLFFKLITDPWRSDDAVNDATRPLVSANWTEGFRTKHFKILSEVRKKRKNFFVDYLEKYFCMTCTLESKNDLFPENCSIMIVFSIWLPIKNNRKKSCTDFNKINIFYHVILVYVRNFNYNCKCLVEF